MRKGYARPREMGLSGQAGVRARKLGHYYISDMIRNA